MTTTFDTSKELAKYMQVETENKWVKDEDNIWLANSTNILEMSDANYVSSPAPSLEELLRVSPIDIEIRFAHAAQRIVIEYRKYFKNQMSASAMINIDKSDNLVEQVALIILEYYRSKENDKI